MQLEERPRDRLGRPYAAIMLSGPKLGQPPPNKGRKFPPAPYTPEQIEAIMKGCGRGKAGARDRAIIAVMWRAGGRVNETTRLQVGDVDLDRRTIHFRFGKGSRGRGVKPRLVAMDQVCVAYLERWLDVRATLGVKRGTPLFCTISKGNVGAPVKPGVLRDKLRGIGERAGLDRQCNPHAFRHTCAVNMLEERFTIREVQEQLGHGDLNTTARYAGHLWPGELLRKMAERTHVPGGPRRTPAEAAVDLHELARLVAAEMRAAA